MCTLTICADDSGGYRLMHNRDEQRGRAPGLPASWRTLGNGVEVLCPLDPVGGGTWIGVRRDGLSAAMLNLNLEPQPVLPTGLRSRGLVPIELLQRVPSGVAGPALGAAVIEAVGSIDLSSFAPFRAVVTAAGRDVAIDGPRWAGRATCVVVRWDRVTLAVTTPPAAAPVCVVSSGLGDSRVACRQPLFEAMVGARGDAAAQREFHRHRWADRPEVSVLMSRAEARTVSITTLSVGRGAVGLGVEPVAE